MTKQQADEFADLKNSVAEIKLLLSELKPTADAIRQTQVAMVDVSKDTNTNAHLSKHAALGTQRNMDGFTNLTAQQYEKINSVLQEFKTQAEKIQELSTDMKAFKELATMKIWAEIVEERSINKEFRSKFTYGWWLILAIGAFAAVVTGVFVAIKNLGTLFK